MNSGLKISLPGVDATHASPEQLAVSSTYPNLKCDLRVQPRNYGLINLSIASLAASKVVYQQKHSYTYTPSFITVWNYPAGTTPSNALTNTTFGIGDIDATLGNGLIVTMATDNTNFTITANPAGGALTNISMTIRFFVYADDFSL